MNYNNEITIIDKQNLRNKIYIIRGKQVMLDFELAEIYRYETRSFNQQIKNNLDRFEGEEYMFQLTYQEVRNLVSENIISNWGGIRKLPYAFTEQGIYMLMTVLKGELAVKQSRKLISLFKEMKDYLIENQQFIVSSKDYAFLSNKVLENTSDIQDIKSNMVRKADLTTFMRLFDSGIKHEEVLILNGEPFKADLAYQKIYKKAKKNIFIIDDYIGIKTLEHLACVKQNVKVKIFSDNKAKTPLRLFEFEDFKKEHPKLNIEFFKTQNKVHDRYIILDYNTNETKIYHCGTSSKDAGKKITTIINSNDIDNYDNVIKKMLNNSILNLK